MEASQTVTGRLIAQYNKQKEQTAEALAEVLCSAYKDATGRYPESIVREKIFQAVT